MQMQPFFENLAIPESPTASAEQVEEVMTAKSSAAIFSGPTNRLSLPSRLGTEASEGSGRNRTPQDSPGASGTGNSSLPQTVEEIGKLIEHSDVLQTILSIDKAEHG